jgi:hypothetical protein
MCKINQARINYRLRRKTKNRYFRMKTAPIKIQKTAAQEKEIKRGGVPLVRDSAASPE